MPAVVRGIKPYLHDHPRRRVAESFARRYPPSGGLGCLGVAAPSPDRTRARGPPGTRVRELREIRDRGRGLIYVPCAEHHAHPAVQFVELELSQRVVLAEQGDQALTVGVAGLRPRAAGRGTRHRYAVGRATTAVP